MFTRLRFGPDLHSADRFFRRTCVKFGLASRSTMRILIATVTAGAGHVQAAAALEEAWRASRPQDTLQRFDVLEFTPKLYRKVYIEGYVKLVENAPELWAHIFKKTD